MYEAPSSNPILPRKKINKKKDNFLKRSLIFFSFSENRVKGIKGDYQLGTKMTGLNF
jgi:hypothetical protein